MKKSIILILVSFWAHLGNCQNTITVQHKYYTLEYDTVLKSPLISWYIQTTAHATSQVKIDRKTVASFHQDPLISEKYQVANDKQYSTYNAVHKSDSLRKDKGHLSPYTAFDFDSIAARESMYYTNTAPQFSFFNEHPWERLEQYVLKTLALANDSIIVYTGCLYGMEKMNDVPIPDYYWKVIVLHSGELTCYLAKNEITDNTDFKRYLVSPDAHKNFIHFYYPNLKIPF